MAMIRVDWLICNSLSVALDTVSLVAPCVVYPRGDGGSGPITSHTLVAVGDHREGPNAMETLKRD
jgi:hypothetical protein